MNAAIATTPTEAPEVRPKYLTHHAVPMIDLEEVLADVSKAFRMTPAEVLSRDRHKSVAAARHIVAWLCRTLPPDPMSFPELGRLLGNRDHTTIMSAVRRIQRHVDARTPLGLAALSFLPKPPAPAQTPQLELPGVSAR